MSQNYSKIVDGLQQMLGRDTEITAGKVISGSVDLNAMACSVSVLWSTDTPLTDVQFTSLLNNNKGVIPIPADNSFVIVASIDGGGKYFIVMCSQVKQYIINVDDEFTITAPKTVFNKGNNGGVPISSKVATEINGVKKDVNNLRQILAAWTPVANDGGAALKTALAPYLSQTLEDTIEKDISNDKVKH